MKTIMISLTAILICTSVVCVAQEEKSQPFLDFSKEDYDSYKNITNQMDQEVYIPFYTLADKLQAANNYKDASDCLSAARALRELSTDAYSYSMLRSVIARYSEQSKENVDLLIICLESYLKFTKNTIAQLSQEDFSNIKDKGASILLLKGTDTAKQLEKYYVSQLDYLEKFRNEHFTGQ